MSIQCTAKRVKCVSLNVTLIDPILKFTHPLLHFPSREARNAIGKNWFEKYDFSETANFPWLSPTPARAYACTYVRLCVTPNAAVTYLHHRRRVVAVQNDADISALTLRCPTGVNSSVQNQIWCNGLKFCVHVFVKTWPLVHRCSFRVGPEINCARIGKSRCLIRGIFNRFLHPNYSPLFNNGLLYRQLGWSFVVQPASGCLEFSNTFRQYHFKSDVISMIAMLSKVLLGNSNTTNCNKVIKPPTCFSSVLSTLLHTALKAHLHEARFSATFQNWVYVTSTFLNLYYAMCEIGTNTKWVN